ncbi:MAG: DUF1573 domain-containing protein [bacterium]
MLAVGDSTRLEIIFSTKTYSRLMKKNPRITTNEGPPDKTVTIETNVVARPDSTYPAIVDPYKLDMSQFSEKKVQEKEFEITNVSDVPLEVTLIAAPVDLMKIELPERLEPGQSGKGRITLRDSAMEESFEKSFTFELSDDEHSRFTVPVKRSMRTPGTSITEVKKDQGKG